MTRIIGLDCATDAANVGLALGWYDDTGTSISVMTTGTKRTSVLEIIIQWLVDDIPTLITLDAPLGWPTHMGIELCAHKAGELISTPPDTMFRRETDRVIRSAIHKQPLEVGADRIARTAHAALTLLSQLRSTTKNDIPLAWKSTDVTRVHAIEVYPAATLRAHGYRKIADTETSEGIAILAVLSKHMALPENYQQISSRHAVDAAVCVLAGVDFLKGNAKEPMDLELAKKEGWIWSKTPE